MMNWKAFGRKPSWPNFKALSRHSPEGTEEDHEKPLIWIGGRRGRESNPGSLEYKVRVLTFRIVFWDVLPCKMIVD
jgi:hypothetical protein